MNRKTVTMAAGIIVLFGMTGAYAALKNYNAKQAEQGETAAEGTEILSIDSSDMTEVEFTINHAQVSFLKTENMWKKSDDETFPVDESAILSALSELSSLKAVRTLENVMDSSEYGMDEPQNTIRLTDTEGEETELVIGATNSGTGDDYVMLNGEEKVIYTISSALRTSFSDDLYDYAVSEEIPYVQASSVTKVSVENAEKSYELYLEDNVWKAAEIVSLEAELEAAQRESREKMTEAESTMGYGEVVDVDAELVNAALADLSGLAYADYVDHNCKNADKYGITEDGIVLTVCWQEKVKSAETESAESESAEMESAEMESTEMESAESESAEMESTEMESTEMESAESESENAEKYELHTLTFYIGNTDEVGNYYVQQKNSAEVHTIAASVLDQFLQVSAQDWRAEEVQTEES